MRSILLHRSINQLQQSKVALHYGRRSRTRNICKLRLCYDHDVCLSVCLSITLVDCDHVVQQKWKWAHERIGVSHRYPLNGVSATCTLNPTRVVITCDLEFNQSINQSIYFAIKGHRPLTNHTSSTNITTERKAKLYKLCRYRYNVS